MEEIKNYLNALLSEKKIQIGTVTTNGCIMITMYDAIIFITQHNKLSDCAIDFCYDGNGETEILTREYGEQLIEAANICQTLNRLLIQHRAEKNLNGFGEDTYK